MRWVTRSRPKTDRIACPWLILRFIDPEGQIVYVPAKDVLAYAKRQGARSFDAPGAEFTHRDGKCTFEVLVEEFRIEDAAVRRIAAIVHGADIDGEIEATPQSAGLLAIAEGFRHMEEDDQTSLALSSLSTTPSTSGLAGSPKAQPGPSGARRSLGLPERAPWCSARPGSRRAAGSWPRGESGPG
jgi:hypothetical protein